MLVLLVVTLVVPTHDVMATDVTNAFAGPSSSHPLGTDNLGRDVWSLMANGCWRTLVVVGVATAVSLLVGGVLGLAGGYFGGAASSLANLVADLTLTIPTFVLALVFSGLFGLTPLGAGVVIGIGGIGDYAVQVMALTRDVCGREFVLAERALGIPVWRVLLLHVVPNVARPLVTYMATKASGVTLQYAALAFIGLGTDVSNPDWGTMLYQYRSYMLTHPSLVLLPMAGIFLVALFFHVVFDEGGTDE